MASKFHCFSFLPNEPVGVLFFVGLIEAFFFIGMEAFLFVEVFIWASLFAEVVEAFRVLVCRMKHLCLTEFRIPDIVEKVEGVDEIFFR